MFMVVSCCFIKLTSILLPTISIILVEKKELHDLVRKSFLCSTKYLKQAFKIWNKIEQDKNKFLEIACQQNLIKLRYVSFFALTIAVLCALCKCYLLVFLM